jgi:aromatic ring-cleaving dioxygenase
MVRTVVASVALAVGASAACQPKDHSDFTSYTAWLIHHRNNPASVAAKNIVQQQFCEKFSIAPCAVGGDEGSLRLVGDLAVEIPRARFGEVVPWLMQQRHSRVSGAGYDLDLKLSPVSGCPDLDANEYSLFIGHDYSFNPRELPGADIAEGESLASLDFSGNDWAYSCSDDCKRSDEWNVCIGEPANNTACNSVSQGFHLHLYFSNNDPASETAKDNFHSAIASTFGVSETVCPDDYGHEQPHDRSCFLTGPGGKESDYPQAGGRSSFATGTHSFYICSEAKCPGDFTNIVSWLMVFKNAEKLGADVTFLLHPTFGCNFADHENWGFRSRLPAIGSSTHVQNNLYGIESSGDYTGKTAPSVDPNSATWPSKTETGCTDHSKIELFSLHVLYNSQDKSAMAAKTSFVQGLTSEFATALKNNDLCVGEADDNAYLKETSPFLAGHLEIGVKRAQLADALFWAQTNRPSGVDILVTADSGCPFADYTKQALWSGGRWSLNEHAFYTGDMARFSGSCFGESAASAASTATGAAGDFLVLVQRAPDNSWQSSAQSTFLDAFASDFSLTRRECASKNFELEPSLTKLCMMEESNDPYKNSYDPNTAAYGRMYVPQSHGSDVLAWVMEHQAAKSSGYALDMKIVPLTGEAASDYQGYALHGNSYWAVKAGSFSKQNAVSV